MSTIITLELCTEDRARLDSILEALSKLTSCGGCVSAAPESKEVAEDDVQKKLAEAIQRAKAGQPTESPKIEPEEAKAPTLPSTPEKEESPKADESVQPATEQTVSRADIRALYIQLAGTSKKEEAKAIIQSYAPKLPDIPEDKFAELYGKLKALEG